ncbi:MULTISPECIES: SulP family inorganic anion transporter [Caballeronia]|jgi:sulfate permease, SulP family|uniref:Sulfate transporter n=1 Tax=Caballeronia zhejiangensis TaxID=871203 RepID=A0A656QEM0_9BURK|nr:MULTISPECIES: SulP family inorganic anion transporter [Caballeronia]EKS70151.1 sulfate transporter [Burkholderia sp. SJ98]KDR28829.1 sulfate transporter [Caballeronia zhejiangensis]MDR5767758.1 SulP family inorganic anion transporter [Caballeronia sp. LZ028]MDR5790842.1 SulP family inorganic anion transporter [Caballeronia sp. LP003]
MPHRASIAPEWLFRYEKPWARADIVAGLTAGAVVIPKALAYATIAGLPVQVGLYTACVPMIVYAFVGTSRALSVSTTTTLAILAANALGATVANGDPHALAVANATLTMLVGIMLVAGACLRLGFVANFISEPVLVGFKAGVAIVIVVDQLPKLFGIHYPKGSFFHNVGAFVAGLPHLSASTLALALATLAALIALERFAPRAPAPLFVVAAAIVAVAAFGLRAHGVETVGAVPAGLPSWTRPDLSLALKLWPDALGIALMSFTESIAAARAFARNDEPAPDANRELLATGLANAAGALFGAMVSGGGTSQTAVNRQAGARTQLAGLVTAALALAVMLLFAPLMALMPHATLAAVVVFYSIGLFSPAEFRAILKIRRTEFVWALTACAGVVLFGTLEGIVVAIVVSLFALAHQVSNPPVYALKRIPGTNVFRRASSRHPDDEAFPGLLLLRPEGRIFFANAQRVAEKIRPLVRDSDAKIVVLDLSRVFDVEYTALKMMIEAEARLAANGTTLWLAGLNPGVLAAVRRSPLGALLGEARMFYNLEHVVAKYQEIVSRNGDEVARR